MFLPRTASELPPAKSVEAQSSAHQCDKRQSHISSSAFSSLLLVLAGLGWAGLGWAGLGAVRISRIVFYDEWTSWAPTSTSLALYIYTVIIYTIYIISTELLSSLSTELLFILSICRFPLLLYPQRSRTRWWWPRHSSAVCTNEIAIFLITVQLRCRHRVQRSRNNTRSPEISIIHSQ